MISRRNIFLVWLIVQVTVLGGWASQHEWQRQHAPRVLLKLAPVDPYDLVRGRYQRISFDIENVPTSVVQQSAVCKDDLKYHETPVWLVLKKGSHEWYEVDSIHREFPADKEFVVRSTYSGPWSHWDSKTNKHSQMGLQVSMGIDRYFIPAGHYDLPRGTNHVVCGEVSVTRSGTPQLERLMIDGKPY